MDKNDKKKKQEQRQGWICLGLWAVLICAGIIAKRVFEHAEWMVFFHLPAAVFLVMAFRQLSGDFRRRYRLELLRPRVSPSIGQRPSTQSGPQSLPN